MGAERVRIWIAVSLILFGFGTAIGAESTLAGPGSPVLYVANQTDPGVGLAWIEADFDDSAWTDGTLGLGYDDFGEAAALIRTEVPAGTQSVYVRAAFDLAQVPADAVLRFAVDYDDGVVMWLNGTILFASPEMPDATPAWDSSATGHESSNGDEPSFTGEVDLSFVGVPQLRSGTNVMAIGVWNSNAESSDLIVVPRLILVTEVVVEPADADGDGVADDADNCPIDANADQTDTDDDGIGDACDPCPDPANGDSDGDGVCDDVDNCPDDANSDQADADDDALGDVCDDGDADGDGLADNADNCPADENADQADADDDGLGDACDTCPNDAANDADGDGVCGDVDNCPANANADQADADGDDLGDACDTCPNDAANDADGDGVCGDVDNCPADANADQADADGDDLGDACDICPLDPDNDADGDGVCGDVDNCPTDANADQANADGDEFGDTCDICPLDPDNDADGDGVCGDVDNCPNDANADQANADGDELGDVCDDCPLDPLNDIDEDDVCGDVDNCPFNANTNQADTDGDGVGNTCDIEWLSTLVNQFKFGVGTIRQQHIYVLGPPTARAVSEFLPTGAGLDALDTLANGDVLFSVAASAGITHSGGFLSLKQDRIYRLDVHSGAVETWLDFESDGGFDVGTLDALDVLQDGTVAFSIVEDRAITHSGGFMMLRQRNAYLYDPSTKEVTLLLDGAATGIVDLDALHVFDDGRIAFSVTTNVWIDGEVLQHENVYRVDDDGSLTVTLDGAAQGVATLDAATFPAAPIAVAPLLMAVSDSYAPAAKTGAGTKTRGKSPDRSR